MHENLFKYVRFIFYYNLMVVTGRKKENMEVESAVLARQRETTYHGEEERADTDLEYSSWFSVVFLTCLSARSRLV